MAGQISDFDGKINVVGRADSRVGDWLAMDTE